MGNVPLHGGTTGRNLLSVGTVADVRLWELLVDTDQKELLMNDGSTTGGFPVSTPIPIVFGKTGVVSATTFLEVGPNVTLSNTHGVRIPFDAEVMFVTHEGTAYSSGRIFLQTDSTNVLVAGSLSADGTISSGFLNDITADEVLNCSINAGSITDPIVTVWIRRKSVA